MSGIGTATTIVNKEILDTLHSPMNDMFVLMNNGVTIIAKKITPLSNSRLSITDFQIVNGCQTSHVLCEQRDMLTKTVMVPVRIIGTDKDTHVNAIIRGTNRQTAVKDEQFFALQEFPKELERFFEAFDEPDKKLYYERRTCQYDRLPIEQARVVTEANVIRSYASMFLHEPHRTTRNYRSLRDKVGVEIFCKGDKIEPYYAASLAWYRLEILFRQETIARKVKPARFHILMVASMKICKGEFPRRNANAMVSYCQYLLKELGNKKEAEKLLLDAARVISEVDDGQYLRDKIRTEEYTGRVKTAVLAELAKEGGANAET